VFLGPRESGSDLGLMAHELTHVAQQGAAGQRAPQRQVQVGDAHSPAEHEADQVAAGCPYIAQYFGRYANQPASAGEALLQRYGDGTAGNDTEIRPGG
jgi:hypothetical protein